MFELVESLGRLVTTNSKSQESCMDLAVLDEREPEAKSRNSSHTAPYQQSNELTWN